MFPFPACLTVLGNAQCKVFWDNFMKLLSKNVLAGSWSFPYLIFCSYLNSHLADKLPAHALVCKIAFIKITINHGHVTGLDSVPCFHQLHVTKSCLIFMWASLPGGFLVWSCCSVVGTELLLCRATICNTWVETSLNIPWQKRQTLDWDKNKCNDVKSHIRNVTNRCDWEARAAGSYRFHEFL